MKKEEVRLVVEGDRLVIEYRGRRWTQTPVGLEGPWEVPFPVVKAHLQIRRECGGMSPVEYVNAKRKEPARPQGRVSGGREEPDQAVPF